MDMGFFLQKEGIFPGVHKIDAPISGPRIADTNFADTRIFRLGVSGFWVGFWASALFGFLCFFLLLPFDLPCPSLPFSVQPLSSQWAQEEDDLRVTGFFGRGCNEAFCSEKKSGKEKTHTHKQICGIVPGPGWVPKICLCVFFGSFLMGEKNT